MSEQQNASSQYNNIHRLILQGELEEAGRACQSLVEQHPTFAPGWAAFSELWLRCGVIDKAGSAAQHGLQIEPDSSELATQLAKCLHFSGQLAGAVNCAKLALKNGPDTVIQLDTLGNIFARAGQHETALALFEEARRLAPNSPGILYNLATSLGIQGKVDEAEALLDQVLDMKPADADAHFARANLRRQTEDSNHVAFLSERLESTRRWQDRVKIHYALAKELEDLQQFEASFDQVEQGAALFSQYSNYDLDAELSGLEAMINATTTVKQSHVTDDHKSGPSPLFVVGLPGSGTAALEETLNRHSEVESTGQVRIWPAAIANALKEQDIKDASLLNLANAIDTLDFPAIGTQYLNTLRLFHPDATHCVDAYPLNVFHIPLIHMALPEARIVLLESNPMVTGYTMFKTLFLSGFGSSYDLETLAKYHAGYQRWVKHLKSVIPSSTLISLELESLAAEPQAESRRVLAFFGLPADTGALADDSSMIRHGGLDESDSQRTSSADIHNGWKNVEARMAGFAQSLSSAEKEFSTK